MPYRSVNKSIKYTNSIKWAECKWRKREKKNEWFWKRFDFWRYRKLNQCVVKQISLNQILTRMKFIFSTKYLIRYQSEIYEAHSSTPFHQFSLWYWDMWKTTYEMCKLHRTSKHTSFEMRRSKFSVFQLCSVYLSQLNLFPILCMKDFSKIKLVSHKNHWSPSLFALKRSTNKFSLVIFLYFL